MNKINHQSYFTNIQALRAVAVLLVLTFHLYAIEGKYFTSHFVPTTLGISGMSGVDLFFVISGFVMMSVSKGQFREPGATSTFLFRRAVRIYPTYWLYSLIVLAVMLVMPQWVNASSGHKADILASFTLFPSHTLPLLLQGWTLTYEVFFYIVFAALIRWSPERNIPAWLLAWALVTLAGFSLTAHHQSASAIAVVITDPLVLEFIAGCAAALLCRSVTRRGGVFCLTTAILLFAVSSLFADREPLDVVVRWRALFFGIPSFVAVLGLAAVEVNKTFIAPRWLCRLGDASYSLYLSHVLVISAVGRLWLHFAGPSHAAFGTAFCACAAVSFGLISYRVIERPLNATLRNVGTSLRGRYMLP